MNKKVLVSVALLFSFLFVPTASALTSSSNLRDCDSNAVMRCGALTTNEVAKKYIQDESARKIFNHFGITNQDIVELEAKAVNGEIRKSGEVVVGGKVVATDAITAGRHDIAGSASANADGVQYFRRSPAVSFRQNSLAAFVVMEGGRFRYAIITSCGNPVNAIPKPVPKPVKPVETPPSPAPTPKPPSPAPPAPSPTPPPVAPTPTPPPPPTPIVPELPNTGAGTLGVVAASSLFAAVAGVSRSMYDSKQWRNIFRTIFQR